MSGNSKISINKYNGKVTIKKKGAKKKKTYTVKVRITAAGNATHEPVSKIVTFKIK